MRLPEKDQLFIEFLPKVSEVLLVRIAEIRENSHVGTDHSFEPLHLARFRNAGFDNGKSFVPVEHQQRERYADLRVVAARAAKQFHTRWAELCDPLFGNRFAVAAGDGNDRTPESVAVVCGEALECGDGIGAPNESRLGIGGGIDVGVGQECADAASVQAADEGMSVVVVAPYRNEQRCGRIVWISAVGDDAFDPAVPARQRTSGYRSDLL